MSVADRKCDVATKTDIAHGDAELRVATRKCCQEQQAHINDTDEDVVKNMLVFFLYCSCPLANHICTVYSGQV